MDRPSQQRGRTPVDPDVAEAVARLSADHAEFFQERAAVLEFDGGQGRRDAEREALAQTRRHFGLPTG